MPSMHSWPASQSALAMQLLVASLVVEHTPIASVGMVRRQTVYCTSKSGHSVDVVHGTRHVPLRQTEGAVQVEAPAPQLGAGTSS